MALEVALKIDVDTHRGLSLGVPRLAAMLGRQGVTASFFVAMGPDNSGRAIVRVLRNPGFLAKMWRTRALSSYGLRTILSGTLLPARPIGLAYPDLLRKLADAGFEVGVHGYDHAAWQDRIDKLSAGSLRSELTDAFEAYRAIFRRPALSFAAPGWRISANALEILDGFHLEYWSNSRGSAPFKCAMAGRDFSTPEIPTTLPTMDEVMGGPGLKDGVSLVRFYLERFRPDALNVHTAHAEIEGMNQLETFTALIDGLKDRGAVFAQLGQVASRLKDAELPVCELVRAELNGRAGWVSAQGPARA